MLDGKSTQSAVGAVPPHLWRIHGRHYDLSDFAAFHPGGQTALALGRGDDCTILFESYHVAAAHHRGALAKYRVDPPDLPALIHPPETAQPLSPFLTDARAMLAAHFAGRGRDAHKAKTGHCALMAAVLALYALAWAGWCCGNAYAVLALPLLAWLVMVNIAHDGSHFAVSARPAVNQLCVYASSPLFYTDATWYVQHVLSHHIGTNDFAADADLHHHGITRWHPEAPARSDVTGMKNLAYHLTAFIAACVILAIVQPLTKFVIPVCFVLHCAALSSSSLALHLLRMSLMRFFSQCARGVQLATRTAVKVALLVTD